MRSYIAGEYERNLFDLKGNRVDKGALLIEHPINKEKNNYLFYHHEGTQTQIEWNSPPSKNISTLKNKFLEQEKLLEELCKEFNILCIPASENGAGGRSQINPKIEYRSQGYNVIFGVETMDLLDPWSGIHYHIDMFKPKIVDQFNALTALARVSGAITATSTINFEGKNGVNCQRQYFFKHKIFNEIPELPGYIGEESDLTSRDERRWTQWREKYLENGGEPAGFDNNFKVYNTGYPDIRRRPDIGKGTLEIRTDDTTTADLFLGSKALVQGYNDKIIYGNIPVIKAEADWQYKFDDNMIVLPNSHTLGELNQLSIIHGMESNEVQEYLSQIEHFARPWLKQFSEEKYLDPVKEIIYSGKNNSSQLLNYLKNSGNGPNKEDFYSQSALREANLFMWRKQQEAVDKLRGY
jgi:hypothetical protein